MLTFPDGLFSYIEVDGVPILTERANSSASNALVLNKILHNKDSRVKMQIKPQPHRLGSVIYGLYEVFEDGSRVPLFEDSIQYPVKEELRRTYGFSTSNRIRKVWNNVDSVNEIDSRTLSSVREMIDSFFSLLQNGAPIDDAISSWDLDPPALIAQRVEAHMENMGGRDILEFEKNYDDLEVEIGESSILMAFRKSRKPILSVRSSTNRSMTIEVYSIYFYFSDGRLHLISENL